MKMVLTVADSSHQHREVLNLHEIFIYNASFYIICRQYKIKPEYRNLV